ncbi:MAG: peptide-binding protein [Firmicutes bacterium]|jgi:peptide/nickel transport system substrate-binding protein|nr:peptide-binding protein [Bacillota bacterium]
MKRFTSIILVGLLIGASLLTGCGGNDMAVSQEGEVKAEASSDTKSKSIVYGLWSSPTGVFNPILYDEEYDAAVIELVYSKLFKLDGNLDLVPSLAKSYSVSEDNMTLTFQLRDDVKWHDGEAFTGEDVVFTFKSMAHPDYTGPRFGEVEKIVGAKEYHDGVADDVEGIKLVDEFTVSIQFKEVFAPGLVRLGADRGIVPEHIWSKIPVKQWKESATELNNPIGTGAYKINEFVPGQYVKLEAFEDFFEGKAKTDTFIFKVANQDTAMAELVNGDIDIADISSLKAEDFEELKSAGIKIASYAGKSYQYMGFNLRQERFQDKKLKQAIFYAIDRGTIVDKLMNGNGIVLNAPLVPTGWAYPEDGLNTYEFNPDKAKDLLKEAGYEDKDGDGYVEDSKGEKLSFVLKYPIGNKTREKSAPVIQKYLKDVGIEIELRNMEFGALLDEVMSNHDFDLYLLGSSLSLDPDPKPIWHSDAASDEIGNAAWNIVGFRNEEADKYIMNGLGVLDTKVRAENYKEFCKIVNEEAPQVYLYAPSVVKAYNPNLKNFSPATYLDYYDFEEWVIEQ